MGIRPQAISIAFGLAFVLACETGVPPATAAASVEQFAVRFQSDRPGGDAAPPSERRAQHKAPLPSHHREPEQRRRPDLGRQAGLRPPTGVSAEELTRILQCHSARVLLGKVNPADIPDDPYWLADRWLDIQVTPENGNFTVTVVSDSVHDNIEVLGRATRYAHEHMLAIESVP